MRFKSAKSSFLFAIVSLVLCVAMLASTTYAWYTDDVTLKNNVVQAGVLDLEIKQKGSTLNDKQIAELKITNLKPDKYYNIGGTSSGVFYYDKWEPGYAVPASFIIHNAGTLAFEYKFTFQIFPEDSKTGQENAVGTEYEGDLDFATENLENVIKVYKGTSRTDCVDANYIGTVADIRDFSFNALYASNTDVFQGWLAADGKTAVDPHDPTDVVGDTTDPIDIILLLPEDVGNEYQNSSLVFGVTAYANQKNYEEDGFKNPDYDEFPEEIDIYAPDESTWKDAGLYLSGHGYTLDSLYVPWYSIINESAGSTELPSEDELLKRYMDEKGIDEISTHMELSFDYSTKTIEDDTICIAMYTDNMTSTEIWHSDGDLLIRNDVKIIGDNDGYGYGGVFAHSGLTGVRIPSSVEYIGSDAFLDSEKLTSVEIAGNNLVTIASGAFENIRVSSFRIPTSVKTIGANAFAFNTNLKSIKLPDGLVNLGAGAFTYSGIQSLKLPDNITYIPFELVRACNNLKSITLSPSTTDIDYFAFADTPSLKSIYLPDSIKSLGEYVFSNSGIESLRIPLSVTNLPVAMVQYCSNLKTLYIHNGVKSIGGYALEYSGIRDIYYEGTKAEWNAISKGENWNKEDNEMVVHCSDGDIYIKATNGSEIYIDGTLPAVGQPFVRFPKSAFGKTVEQFVADGGEICTVTDGTNEYMLKLGIVHHPGIAGLSSPSDIVVLHYDGYDYDYFVNIGDSSSYNSLHTSDVIPDSFGWHCATQKSSFNYYYYFNNYASTINQILSPNMKFYGTENKVTTDISY